METRIKLTNAVFEDLKIVHHCSTTGAGTLPQPSSDDHQGSHTRGAGADQGVQASDPGVTAGLLCPADFNQRLIGDSNTAPRACFPVVTHPARSVV